MKDEGEDHGGDQQGASRGANADGCCDTNMV